MLADAVALASATGQRRATHLQTPMLAALHAGGRHLQREIRDPRALGRDDLDSQDDARTLVTAVDAAFQLARDLVAPRDDPVRPPGRVRGHRGADRGHGGGSAGGSGMAPEEANELEIRPTRRLYDGRWSWRSLGRPAGRRPLLLLAARHAILIVARSHW